MKALADIKINVAQNLKFGRRTENIWGKGEDSSYQHFLLFPKCFQKPSTSESLKVEMCGEELNYKYVV